MAGNIGCSDIFPEESSPGADAKTKRGRFVVDMY